MSVGTGPISLDVSCFCHSGPHAPSGIIPRKTAFYSRSGHLTTPPFPKKCPSRGVLLMDWSAVWTELPKAVGPFVGIVVGGLLAIAGGVAGQYFTHRFTRDRETEKLIRRKRNSSSMSCMRIDIGLTPSIMRRSLSTRSMRPHHRLSGHTPFRASTFQNYDSSLTRCVGR